MKIIYNIDKYCAELEEYNKPDGSIGLRHKQSTHYKLALESLILCKDGDIAVFYANSSIMLAHYTSLIDEYRKEIRIERSAMIRG